MLIAKNGYSYRKKHETLSINVLMLTIEKIYIVKSFIRVVFIPCVANIQFSINAFDVLY